MAEMSPRILPILAALAIVATLAGCGGKSGTTVGSVEIDGSKAVAPILGESARAYKRVAPEVEVYVNKTGTDDGFRKYLRNETDIVAASRLASPEEDARAREQGIEWVRFRVGNETVAVVVSARNTFVEELEFALLKRLWKPQSDLKNWNDLNPAWPNRPIRLRAAHEDAGITETFHETVIGEGPMRRSDVHVMPVANDPDAIGYVGLDSVRSGAKELRLVTVRDGEARPSLSRPLYLYVKKAALRRPAVFGFVKYTLENVVKLATEAGLGAPTATEVAANAEAFAPAVAAVAVAVEAKP